ncbi:VOC family protein [Marinicella sp. W31]|uniref:VOC family protein n=1 Tax=Marinicella sp. W31 TaxID=3023713 RepID=UPI003756CEEF
MKYHQGRLIDHIGIYVSNLERSRNFYLAILTALGKSEGFGIDNDGFHFDEFYIAEGHNPATNLHLAFQAESIEHVHAFYQAGLNAGGRDNGEPGYREYHASYYAAFLLDPDGNNIEAVCDVGAERSNDSVVVTRNNSDG